MHEFIVVCLKKLLNESGRKQVELKAAAKGILSNFQFFKSLSRLIDFFSFEFQLLGEIDAPGCVLTVTKDDVNEVV
jgi:hypothetical protein